MCSSGNGGCAEKRGQVHFYWQQVSRLFAASAGTALIAPVMARARMTQRAEAVGMTWDSSAQGAVR